MVAGDIHINCVHARVLLNARHAVAEVVVLRSASHHTDAFVKLLNDERAYSFAIAFFAIYIFIVSNVRESEFLPTIASLVKYCENDWEIYGLPDPRTAFIEACMAPNPKANHNWSHPAVFHAGQATDWFFLATQEERRTFPVFERYYRTLCERVRQGEKLEAPVPLALPEPTPQPLAREELQKQLDAIRKELNQ